MGYSILRDQSHKTYCWLWDHSQNPIFSTLGSIPDLDWDFSFSHGFIYTNVGLIFELFRYLKTTYLIVVSINNEVIIRLHSIFLCTLFVNYWIPTIVKHYKSCLPFEQTSLTCHLTNICSKKYLFSSSAWTRTFV